MNDARSLSSNFLEQLKDRQPMAWSRLVEAFSPIVYHWCRKSGLSGHDAADVVQEVFASVSRGIHRFHREGPKTSFRAWLSTITRTKLADHFRRHQSRPAATGGTEAYDRMCNVPDLESDADSQSSLQCMLARQTLQQIEEEFEPRTWSAFWRTAIENQAAADVAKALEINVASVYQARCRVLRRLKQRLSELP